MMTIEEMERADELGAELGDPRRCPRHPDQKTSSNDGLFDAPCGKCEHEIETGQLWEDYEKWINEVHLPAMNAKSAATGLTEAHDAFDIPF